MAHLSLSHRGKSIPASPLRKLANVAQARKASGIQVYHLNIGQPDIPTPQVFLDAVHQFTDSPIAYTHSQGVTETIAAWQQYYEGCGINLKTDDIMVTSGGSEALQVAISLVTDPGDNILVFEPFYTNYTSFALLSGVTLKAVETSIETGFHLPAREVIESAIDGQTRAILICNPANPTGTVLTEAELQRLVDIAIEHDLFIIADEVYREFVFEHATRSLLQFPQASDRVIVVDSVSKRFSACGVRIGALVSRNQEIMTAAIRCGMARLSVATIEQQAIVPVLQQASSLIPPVIAEYRKRRDVVYELLSTMPGVVTAKPEGALYNICQLPVDSAERFVQWMIEEFEDNRETVLLAPAAGFYATAGKGAREARIAYVLNTEDMHHALDLVRIGLERYPHRIK